MDVDKTAAQFLTELVTLSQPNALLEAERRDHRETVRIMTAQQHALACIAKVVPFLLYVHDLVNQCNLYVNDRSVALLGYTADEIQAQGAAFFRRVMHPDDLSYLVGEFPQRFAMAADGEVIETRYRIQHANGQWRWFRSRDVVLTYRSCGAPWQILGTAEDITPGQRSGKSELNRQPQGRERLDQYR